MADLLYFGDRYYLRGLFRQMVTVLSLDGAQSVRGFIKYIVSPNRNSPKAATFRPNRIEACALTRETRHEYQAIETV